MIGPYRIVATGSPHDGSLRWRIQLPGGVLSAQGFDTSRHAEYIARRWIELDSLEV